MAPPLACDLSGEPEYEMGNLLAHARLPTAGRPQEGAFVLFA
jgi:hypothetical protein